MAFGLEWLLKINNMRTKSSSSSVILFLLANLIAFGSCNARVQMHDASNLESLVENKAFNALRKQSKIYSQNQKNQPDGSLIKVTFYNDLGEAFSHLDAKGEKFWEEKIEDVIKGTTDLSVGDAFLYATIYRAFAWRHRGNDFIQNVGKNEIQNFHDKSKKALNILGMSRGAVLDPEFYRQKILLELGNGGTMASAKSNAIKGLELSPEYHSLITDALVQHYPQWGGSLVEMQNFLASIKSQLPEAEASVVYARAIYSAFHGGIYAVLNKKSPINWSEARVSFESLTKRFPTERNHQKYFMLSCYHADKEGALEFYKKVKGDFDPEIFNSDPSIAANCRDWVNGRLPGFVLRLHYANKPPEEFLIL